MKPSIRIGNQTAFSAATFLEPFEFAFTQGFDAFEWFPDKKANPDGVPSGWDLSDMDEIQRREIREVGQSHGIVYTVHAPWQANPLRPGGTEILRESLDFARAIGAGLVNLHLYMDEGSQPYIDALAPVIVDAARLGVRLSLENTPLTTPEHCNATFACLKKTGLKTEHVGMCLDIGHANLCENTHNDYLRFVDRLSTDISLIHLHMHENYGDRDSHLPLFTGPAGNDDRGVRAFIARIKERHYNGALILEQWPSPPTLLLESDRLLRSLLGLSDRKQRQQRYQNAVASSPIGLTQEPF